MQLWELELGATVAKLVTAFTAFKFSHAADQPTVVQDPRVVISKTRRSLRKLGRVPWDAVLSGTFKGRLYTWRVRLGFATRRSCYAVNWYT